MERLFKSAENLYKEGLKRLESKDTRASLDYFQRALRDLIVIKPDKKRDTLLAKIYLSRFTVAKDVDYDSALTDLRIGYSYARTSREPEVQEQAQKLWQSHLLKDIPNPNED